MATPENSEEQVQEEAEAEQVLVPPLPYEDRGDVLYVHVLCMRKGDCILIVVPTDAGHETLLVDTAGEPGRVLDYLRRHHIPNLKYAINTHPDKDHCEYMRQILTTDEQYAPGEIWFTEYFHHDLCEDIRKIFDYAGNNGTRRFPEHLQTLQFGQNGNAITIQVLAPNTKFRDNFREKPADTEWGFSCEAEKFRKFNHNNTSLVILIDYLGTKILLTGDAGESEWKSIQTEFGGGNTFHCDVLKVSHHGSPEGTYDFLPKFVNAEFAVITRGPDYDYEGERMPTQGVKDLLMNQMGVKEIYSVVEADEDRDEVEDPMPLSFIFAVVPSKSRTEAKVVPIRFYSFTSADRALRAGFTKKFRNYYTMHYGDYWLSEEPVEKAAKKAAAKKAPKKARRG